MIVPDRQIATNESRGYYEYDAFATNYIPIQRDELNVELIIPINGRQP
jgi:porin